MIVHSRTHLRLGPGITAFARRPGPLYVVVWSRYSAMPGPARPGRAWHESAQVSRAYPGYVTDHPAIDPHAPKLIYEQVADHITEQIESGTLVPGARLPAERDLATEYGVAYDTIRRATALLRERELIITIVGRGTFVAEK
jgi:GntR family transcriptional regulator